MTNKMKEKVVNGYHLIRTLDAEEINSKVGFWIKL